jgi:hypothetical protein
MGMVSVNPVQISWWHREHDSRSGGGGGLVVGGRGVQGEKDLQKVTIRVDIYDV